MHKPTPSAARWARLSIAPGWTRTARLLLALLLPWIGGCSPIVPTDGAQPPAVPSVAATAPQVTLDVSATGNVQPGDIVEIRVTGGRDDAVDAFRLAIDGADTGWRDQAGHPEAALHYTWIAGEPDTYEVVAQARDRNGSIGETRRQIVVMPYAGAEKTGTASLTTTEVALPTYPIEEYQTPALDRVYNWPYLAFDRERYLLDAPAPTVRRYTLLVLENDYLQVSILPELGGRIWQVLHKPSGDSMFYQNTVVKPSPWGPLHQGGWLGLGGIEWALPVIEHGYDWGTAWVVSPFTRDDGAVGVTIATPDDGRLLAATITVTLPPDAAYVEIEPAIRNLAAHRLAFNYWHTAMLAPGRGNRPSADLHFVIPGTVMTVHSTGDTAMPGPRARFTWPRYFGRDLSRLGNWDHYLGFFEYPAAHGPFVGVYDPAYDAGAVRAFPAQVARGSKVFGLGWRRAIGSENFTDDDSAYVELHAGLAPSFFAAYALPADGLIAWAERWYPVQGIGDMVYANRAAALNLRPVAGGVEVGLYAPTVLAATLIMDDAAAGVTQRIPVTLGPETPYRQRIERVTFGPALTLHLEDGEGRILLTYTPGPPRHGR